ncbi:MAG: transglutaminase domain-containing protein [Armatimonadota bacterium]
MKKGLVIIMALVTGLAAFGLCPAFGDQQIPSESWMGVYMAGQKLGYMHMTTERAQFEGRDCLRIQSFFRTKMVLLGANVQQDIKTTVYTDERFTPIFETFNMSSGGSSTTVEARFSDREIKCKVINTQSTSEKVVPIAEGVSLVGDSMYALGPGNIEIGQKAKMYFFNPLTLNIEPIAVEVIRREEVDVKGIKYNAFVIKNTMPMTGDMTCWHTEDGKLIKSEALMGLTMITESAEEAVAGVDSDYVPPTDLAVLTSVKANIDLPDPRSTKKLIIKLSGKLEPKMGISDKRQQVKWLNESGETKTAEFTIDSGSFDAKNSVTLPVTNSSLSKYIQPTAYLQSDAPEIKAKAAEIVGNEKSAYKAAKKIRAWVSSNIKPQADIGIARPSLDVLKMKVGVCRDYAVIFAALARAAGIPTKVVAGIVYMNGSFYYHAWVESYVGEWVAFDATQKTDFVDATHIKFAEGDATNMFEMSPVFGTLKAEIVKYH